VSHKPAGLLNQHKQTPKWINQLLNNCKNQPVGFNNNSRPALAGRDKMQQKDRTLEKGSIQFGDDVSTRVITNIARQT
jgi:hypothetical protein